MFNRNEYIFVECNFNYFVVVLLLPTDIQLNQNSEGMSLKTVMNLYFYSRYADSLIYILC